MLDDSNKRLKIDKIVRIRVSKKHCEESVFIPEEFVFVFYAVLHYFILRKMLSKEFDHFREVFQLKSAHYEEITEKVVGDQKMVALKMEQFNSNLLPRI